MKQRVLFLNPPSVDGRLYNRHVMDPHVSKGDYLYPPYDFLMMSGHFHPSEQFELHILDAIAEGLSAERCAEAVRAFRPDAIVALTAPQSHQLDMDFLARLKHENGGLMLTMGAVQHARKRAVLDRHDWMDGIVREAIGDGLKRFLLGETGPFPNLLLRSDPPDWQGMGPPTGREFDFPLPRHDLLPLDRYRYPGMVTRRFTSTLASYGCPFMCTYCEAPGFGFKYRPAASVMEELRFIRSLDVREVCFKDWTFAANRKHAEALLDLMIEADLGIRWFTFSRVDVLDRELIRKMRRAGCHTLQIGVESAQTDLLVNFKRKVNRERLEEVFRTCHEEGVSTLATLILGLPGDNEEGILKTIDYVIKLDADYASFNIITPLIGSKLREEWEEAGIVDPDLYEVQDSTRAVLRNVDVTPERLEQLRDLAVRRFYFRPTYLLKRLTRVRSFSHLRSQTAVGWSLFRQHVLPTA
jgi:anaerobic magnesium-protoporphyrin IX monomethyl ester cyclase